MLESRFKRDFIKDLKSLFPDCIIINNDARCGHHIQGFPDLLILNGPYWAALETKRSSRAERQPNQEYYVDLCNELAYSSFVSPENVEEVIVELQSALQTCRPTRRAKR